EHGPAQAHHPPAAAITPATETSARGVTGAARQVAAEDLGHPGRQCHRRRWPQQQPATGQLGMLLATPPGVGYIPGARRPEMIPRHKRDALLRLKTVRGHIDGVIGMVEDEAYCPDVMKQVAALQASLEKVNRVLLGSHLATCV